VLVVPLTTPRPTLPLPFTLPDCEVVPLVMPPLVDVVVVVLFLRMPRPRVGVFAAVVRAASNFAFSAASAAFRRANSAACVAANATAASS